MSTDIWEIHVDQESWSVEKSLENWRIRHRVRLNKAKAAISWQTLSVQIRPGTMTRKTLPLCYISTISMVGEKHMNVFFPDAGGLGEGKNNFRLPDPISATVSRVLPNSPLRFYYSHWPVRLVLPLSILLCHQRFKASSNPPTSSALHLLSPICNIDVYDGRLPLGSGVWKLGDAGSECLWTGYRQASCGLSAVFVIPTLIFWQFRIQTTCIGFIWRTWNTDKQRSWSIRARTEPIRVNICVYPWRLSVLTSSFLAHSLSQT